MNFAYSVRVRLGILLIVVLSLLSSYQLAVRWVAFDLTFIGRDEVTLNEKRFDEIKQHLPSHGVVGYWPNCSPATVEQLIFGNAGDLQHWFLTQYALAPVIVSPTLGQTVIICNYRPMPGSDHPGPPPGTKVSADWKVIDFENGILLCTRELK